MAAPTWMPVVAAASAGRNRTSGMPAASRAADAAAALSLGVNARGAICPGSALPAAKSAGSVESVGARGCVERERQLPRLADKVLPEASMRQRVDQSKTGLLVDVAGRAQDAVGPERDLAVTDLLRESHALAHEPGADPGPSGLGLDQQQAQLSHCLGVLDEEHGPD